MVGFHHCGALLFCLALPFEGICFSAGRDSSQKQGNDDQSVEEIAHSNVNYVLD